MANVEISLESTYNGMERDLTDVLGAVISLSDAMSDVEIYRRAEG